MQKNVPGQRWKVFAFDTTTSVEVTGDAANITANLKKDYGAATATNDVNPTELEDGFYYFDLTQAETNAGILELFPESSTPNVQVIPVPASYTTIASKIVRAEASKLILTSQTIALRPTITDQPDPTSASAGATATFTVAATTPAPHATITYQWQVNTGSSWANISAATSASYTTPTLTIGSNGHLYRCVVSNVFGSENSSSATLTVEAPLVLATAIVDFDVASGVFTDTGGTTPATNGSSVARINSKVGSNNAQQATAGNRPVLATGSFPVLQYRSAAKQLLSTFSLSKPCTVCLVYKLNGAVESVTDVIFDGATIITGALASSGYSPTAMASCNSFVNAGTARNWGWQEAAGQFAIVWIELNASGQVRVNGKQRLAADFGLSAMGGVSLGGLGGSNGRTADFDLARFVVFSGTPSNGDRSAVESYFALLYGITLSTATKQLIYDGDSLTQGWQVGFEQSCPYQTFVLLGNSWNPYNFGRINTRSDQILSDWSSRFSGLYSVSNSENIVVALMGTNDLLQGISLATIQSNISSYVTAIKAAGFKIAIKTVPAMKDYTDGVVPSGAEADRISLNNWIVANSAGANAVIDYSSQTLLSAPGAGANATYFRADRLHLTAAGYALMAAIDAPVIAAM